MAYAGGRHLHHSFDISLDEARRVQEDLRGLVMTDERLPTDDIRIAGGADVAFIPLGEGSARGVDEEGGARRPGRFRWRGDVMALAAVVTVDIATGRTVETVYATAPVHFPYIPGFLSFREGPAVLAAVDELRKPPDVMIFDGCGILHPRGMGLATHMSLLMGIPSAGCAKSLLCGDCDEPGPARGDWTPITLDGDITGSCLRTRDRVRPVYVSPGNGMSVGGARELVMRCVTRYRLPEPTRLAHRLVTARKKDMLSKG